MIPPGSVFHKPKSFIAAKNLLYASLFISLIALFLVDPEHDFTEHGGLRYLLFTAAGFAIVIFLVKQMSFCKKWARTTLLILLILYAGSYFLVWKAYPTVSFYAGALLVFQSLLQILALIFLYRQECNIWFNSSESGTDIFENDKTTGK